MNDNEKKLSEFSDILKWQIDIGADAMVEEKKNNLFLKKERIDKNQKSEELFFEMPHCAYFGNIVSKSVLFLLTHNNQRYNST